MKTSVHKLAFSAVIAAFYAALTMALAPVGFGSLQLRPAEALCALPFFFPSTAWGLFVGCFIANVMSPFGLMDMVLGSLATLGACVCVVLAGRGKKGVGAQITACFMPALWNGVIIGAINAVYTAPAGLFWETFSVCAVQIGASEALVMLLIGLPMMNILPKTRFYGRLKEKL